MSTLKKSKTKKLFYGQWPYKVACVVKNAHYFRSYNTFIPARGFNNNDYVDKFSKKFNELKKLPNLKTRVEGPHINFFTDNKATYNQIIDHLYAYIVEITEPESDNELDLLQNNQKLAIVDTLPHNLFEYKVTFKKLNDSIKNVLIGFIDQQPPGTIKVSKSTHNYLLSTRTYFSNPPFLYVKDSKTLLFLKLISGEYIAHTIQYMKRSDINTVS